MIFDPTTCCACAAVQELQGEAPLTLSGEGLWAGVLSSGQCVLECPGSQSAAGSSRVFSILQWYRSEGQNTS